jgi:cytochrome c oxidase subunit 4
MSHEAYTHDGHAHEGPHIVPLPVYLAIFGALMVLTGLTVWVAVFDLGEYSWLHTPLALLIATVKATLVVLWFMHVKYGARLVWVFIAAGLAWLVILLGITVGDYIGRGWEPAPHEWQAAITVAAPADLG